MKYQWVLCLLTAVSSFLTQPARPTTTENLVGLGYHPTDFMTSKPLVNRGSTGDICSQEPKSKFLNVATEKFAVNGTGIPEVDFDVGESYSGLLPISNKTDERDHMFFWFFPTVNEEHKNDKEITIWLSGGPGCSSLLALLIENGPFVWQPGNLKPRRNPWSWHLLTNVVWIDQPIGTGFSEGEPSITNEDELAAQFMGFWRNFVDLFGMHGWRVNIATESYGGFYGPYISSHFIDANDKDYFNLSGLVIYDGIITDENVHFSVSALPYLSRHKDIFAFNDSTMSSIQSTSDDCGFTEFYDRYLTFPPSDTQPSIYPGTNLLPDGTPANNAVCQEISDVVGYSAAVSNPCFSVYNILDHCPKLFNPVEGNSPYFNRADVKMAIHASPSTDWSMCAGPQVVFKASNGIDGSQSMPSNQKQLPHVIDTTQNVIIAHGDLDGLIPTDSILLGIQNMTWGGQLGFQCKPQDPFYVPLYGFNPEVPGQGYYASDVAAGAGVLGTVHEERGLTFVVTKLAGHQGPGYAPAAAFRHLEKLLGRVSSLSGKEPFTLPELRNITQMEGPLGKGIVIIP